MKVFGFLILALMTVSCFAALGEERCTWGPSYWCKSQDTAKECGTVEYCQTKVWKTEPTPPETRQTQPSDDACTICKLVVNLLEDLVAKNSTEQEAKDEVEKLCSILGSFSKECYDLVNEFFPEIWKFLEEELSSGVICEKIGLCSATVLHTKPKADLCDICKLITSYLKPFVDSNATEAEVKDALDKLCGLLPSQYAAQCTDFVNQYFPQVWKLLQDEIDTGKICVQIGVCPNVAISVVEKVKEPKADLCDICKLITSYLKPFVDSNATEAEVENALDKLCGLLPSKYAAQCTAFVNQYVSQVWKLLQEEIDTGKICVQIGVCPSVSISVVEKVKESKVNEVCQLCKVIDNFLKPYVDANDSSSTVKEFLDEFCELLPGQNVSLCRKVLKEYFPEAWRFLKESIDTGDICAEIGVCPDISTVKKVKESVECLLCTFIIKEVEKFLQDNSTEKEIMAFLDKVCNFLPSELKSECVTFMNQYGPEILQLLVGHFPPSQICEYLKLCSSKVPAITQKWREVVMATKN